MEYRHTGLAGIILLGSALTGASCGLLLQLEDFEDAPEPGDQSSGGGTATTCTPNITEQCYSGPPGTKDVGACRQGTRVCDVSGETWGVCRDEALPGQESCASTQDENCDGLDCTLWARTFGEEGRVNAIATHDNGHIVAAGSFEGSIQFEEQPLLGSGRSDIFLVAFDSFGVHKWSRQFSDAADQEATSVCVDSSGSTVVAGVNEGSINFGGRDVGPGLFIAKFDSNGKHSWSWGFPADPISSLAFTPPRVSCALDDSIVLTGAFAGSLTIHESSLTSSPASRSDIYVAKLDSSSGALNTSSGGWVKHYGGSGSDTLLDVAIDQGSNIIITGNHDEEVRFGELTPIPGRGMFLTKLDRNGVPSWSHGFAGAQSSSLDVDMLGDIAVTGAYKGQIHFGGDELLQGPQGIFVAKFDTTGNHMWSRGFTGGTSSITSSIRADALNNLAVFGTFNSELRIDNEILVAGELPAVLAVKLDPSGNVLWKKPYVNRGIAVGTAADVDDNNELVVTGFSEGDIDLGAGPISIEHSAIFFAKLGI
ncbi:hypothetical protein [Sorangium sp. So ce131]|uniref:hypothetical protein n=1 Tax=Sorangium sp. So ce131 TaxID=3133282 RepID=UPI003F626800